MKDEKIILPEALHDIAIKKAHQGAHPGMSGMKRRLRSHFWFPKMDAKIEKFVSGCHDCQMFTNKRTKHTLTPLATPGKAWENVSIDLFGPMPDHKHVVVVLDSASRFPAAKIVPGTGSRPVIKAIDDIYTDYGQPSSHRTDNGPPFSSEEFANYSLRKGIEHVKTYPYHPQANPAETFMKPLGKAMKSAHHHHESKEDALKALLTSYRSTPHLATGEAPGDVMLRSGYGTEFPRKSLSDDAVNAAFHHDQLQKSQRGCNINASKHRMPFNVAVGSQVYIRNQRSSKFQPIFGPEVFTVVDVANGGVVVRNNINEATYTRHLDDIKLAPQPATSDITWFPPIDPTPSPPATQPQERVPNPSGDVVLPCRSQRSTRPPAYLNDYVVTHV